jgi:hypothetical protein
MKMKRRRGIAGILAGIILFTMIFTAGVGMALYIQNLNHQEDVANYNSQMAEQQAQSENLVINTAVNPTNLNYTVTNIGGISVTIVKSYILPEPSANALPIITATSLSLQVGQASKTQTTTTSCVSATLSNPCTVELLTSRGRVFSQTYPMPGGSTSNQCVIIGGFNNNCLSSSTSGIGALEFNFEAFFYYNCGSAPVGCSVVTPVDRAYGISGAGSNSIVFSVQVKNVDPLQRAITLTSNSYLEAGGFNTAKGGGKSIIFAWQICSASSGVIQTCPYNGATIPADGAFHTIYFGYQANGISQPTSTNPAPLPITPVFMLFTGTVYSTATGTQYWGEDFPLATIDWFS